MWKWQAFYPLRAVCYESPMRTNICKGCLVCLDRWTAAQACLIPKAHFTFTNLFGSGIPLFTYLLSVSSGKCHIPTGTKTSKRHPVLNKSQEIGLVY